MTEKAKQLGIELISPTTLRQTGDCEFRVATQKDFQENIYLRTNLGLTKREYFAAMAIQGLCADDKVTGFDKIARWSVNIADALLEELSKTE